MLGFFGISTKSNNRITIREGKVVIRWILDTRFRILVSSNQHLESNIYSLSWFFKHNLSHRYIKVEGEGTIGAFVVGFVGKFILTNFL